MSEPTRHPNDSSAAAQAFIQFWGDMGAHWGVPRTMALTHALLFIDGRPMNTDEVMGRLTISRGNASMTLRTLVDWGLVTRTHNPSDRKDYYAAEQDVWRLFATVVKARKQREIEPIAGSLQAILDSTRDATDTAGREKIEGMIQFVRLFDQLAERFLALGPGALEMFGEAASRD